MRAKVLLCVALFAGSPALAQQDGPANLYPAPALRPPPPPIPRVAPAPGLLRPIMTTHTIPSYPQESVDAKEQGTTMMEVHITTFGVVDNCTVISSSGFVRLDEAACAHVKAVWRWEPPIQNGTPVNVRTRVQVMWDLRSQQ